LQVILEEGKPMDTTRISEPVVSPPRRRRRQYLINPSFQWKFAIWVMLDVFVVCSLLALVMFGVLEQSVRWRVLNPDAPRTLHTLLVIFGFAGGFGVVAAAGLGLWSVMITHRLCGPLYVVGRGLKELAAGRLPTLRPLRKKDEFKDFYALFQGTVDSLKQAKSTELTALTQILQVVESAARADDPARRNACDFVAERVRVLRKQAADALSNQTDDLPDEPPGDADAPATPLGACAGLPT
jgi:hypothetical protein